MNPATESRFLKLRGILALAAAYAIAARVGLELDAVSGGFATLVWPPTGIAIAALLLFGTSYWPGVFVGAVVANILVGAPLVRAGIGIGNTLEAVAAAYALRHIADFDVGLARLRSVVAFVLVCIVATSISATVGVLSLFAGGMLATPALAEAWRTWWQGDLVGALVVAPAFLVWHSLDQEPMDRRGRVELVSLAAVVALAAAGIFFSSRDEFGQPFLQSYVIFPALILAAVRLATRGAATSVLVTSAIALWGTALQRGPFAQPTLHDSLVNLQAFMGIVATTMLVLGATIAERRMAVQAAERARREAEDANRAKADFMAVISHELRTPLNAISGYVDLLLCGAHGELTPKQLDSLQRINRNYQHLLTLIDDVLGFTRAETGRLTVKPEPVRVADVLDAVESVIDPEVRRKQIAFQRAALDASLIALADPEKLRQIVVNLVTNAVKYTDPGGSVAIDAERADGRVRIRVVDSGIGIPADQLPRVFDPFFQVDRGTARRYPGIGLGLTIARDLATAMKGDIVITSTLGQGTTVVLLLPQP